MSDQDVPELQRQAEELRAEIRDHNERYYDQDAPIISDAEYDALRPRAARPRGARTPSCVTPDSPTQLVGGRRRRPRSPRSCTACR